MARAQHRITLTPDERRHLERLVRSATVPTFTYQRARILLAAEHRSDRPAPTDVLVATALGISTRTVARVRSRWAEVGVAATLQPQSRGTKGRSRFDTETHARIAQVACSAPPPGHAHWTLRLLASEVVELEIVPSISPESVRQMLKKTTSAPGESATGASRLRPTPPLSPPWKTS
jgi:hypothetical protein